MDKTAIYSRKSKYTGRGDSVENQINACKEYIRIHYDVSDKDILIYEDEGFTGANTDRPQYKKMINDIRKKEICRVVCYRLDRISRNTSDFSTLIEELKVLEVGFISVKENFDTNTHMGKAMMLICSVFAGLERDVIAERVRDNMLDLAKTGRWLGGTTPTGYKSKEYEKIEVDGKIRKLFKLVPIDNERRIIELIYNKYLELKSQTKLETYLIQNNIKTKTGINFSRFALKAILNNPVYAKNDMEMYRYFEDNEIEIFAEEKDFDGEKGIMGYNKTIQVKHKSTRQRDILEWIISVRKTSRIYKWKRLDSSTRIDESK